MGNTSCKVDWLRFGSNLEPVGEIEASSVWDRTPFTVTLTAQAIDYDGGIAEYEWDFDGDGTYDITLSGKETEYTYSTAGLHEVKLRLTDNLGASAIASKVIECFTWEYVELFAGCDALLLTVDDRPAVFFHSSISGDPYTTTICYSIADGNSFLNWTQPTVVVDGNHPQVVRIVDIAVVNSKPALCYTLENEFDYFYVVAHDPSGTSWTDAVQIVGVENQIRMPSLSEISGHPAVSCVGGDAASLHYVRANDPLGGNWPEPVDVESTSFSGWDSVLVSTAPGPAIAYMSNEGLSYVCALDQYGGSWSDPVRVVKQFDRVFYCPPFSCILDGDTPVIVYGNRFPRTCGYDHFECVRSMDPLGQQWSWPVELGGPSDSNARPGIVKWKGNLVVAYWSFSTNPFTSAVQHIREDSALGIQWTAPSSIFEPSWYGADTPASLCSAEGKLCGVISPWMYSQERRIVFAFRE